MDRNIVIDGSSFTNAEAEMLAELDLVEKCTDSRCEHQYHAAEGVTENDLLRTIERAITSYPLTLQTLKDVQANLTGRDNFAERVMTSLKQIDSALISADSV